MVTADDKIDGAEHLREIQSRCESFFRTHPVKADSYTLQCDFELLIHEAGRLQALFDRLGPVISLCGQIVEDSRDGRE